MNKKISLFLLFLLLIVSRSSSAHTTGDYQWKVGTGAFEIYIYTKYIREGKTEWNSTIIDEDGDVRDFTFKQGTVERVEVTKINNDKVYGKKQYGYYPCESPCDKSIDYIITEEESIVTEVMKTYHDYWDWNHSWDKSVFSGDDNYSLHSSPGTEGSIVYSSDNMVQKWYVWGGWLYYYYLKIGNTETEIQMLSWWKKNNEVDSSTPGFEIPLFLIPIVTLVLIRSIKNKKKESI